MKINKGGKEWRGASTSVSLVVIGGDAVCGLEFLVFVVGGRVCPHGSKAQSQEFENVVGLRFDPKPRLNLLRSNQLKVVHNTSYS